MQGWMAGGACVRWEGGKVVSKGGGMDEWLERWDILHPKAKTTSVERDPCPFTFRSRCSSSSRTQGRRPRKNKDSPKEVLLPDLHSELPLLHLCGDPQVEQ